MPNTYTKVARVVAGNYREYILDLVPGAVYTAGGTALVTADYEAMTRPGETASTILSFTSEKNSAGATCSLDRTNNKMVFFIGGVEATATINTQSIRCTARFGYSNHK